MVNVCVSNQLTPPGNFRRGNTCELLSSCLPFFQIRSVLRQVLICRVFFSHLFFQYVCRCIEIHKQPIWLDSNLAGTVYLIVSDQNCR